MFQVNAIEVVLVRIWLHFHKNIRGLVPSTWQALTDSLALEICEILENKFCLKCLTVACMKSRKKCRSYDL